MKQITKLTPEQEAMIPAIRDEFLRYGLSTEPADFDAAEHAVKDAYAVAGLTPPKIFIRLASPHEGAIGATIMKNTRMGEDVRAQVGAQVRAAFYSQHEAGWLSFYSYFAKACVLESAKRLEPLTRIAQSCGWVWQFAGAAIITDRPRTLRRDDQNRLHCEDGPALEYRDGFAIFAWHGTRIPREWVEDKTSLSAKTALTWENIEQRRCALEIVGWHNVLRELNAKVVDEHPDPLCGALVEVQLPDLDRKSRFIHAQCGTKREFAIGVPPEMKSVVEAQAWLTGLPVETFQFPTVRT